MEEPVDVDAEAQRDPVVHAEAQRDRVVDAEADPVVDAERVPPDAEVRRDQVVKRDVPVKVAAEINANQDHAVNLRDALGLNPVVDLRDIAVDQRIDVN